MATIQGFYACSGIFEERHPADHWFAGATSRSEVEAIYRHAAKTAHPDAGGTHQAMYELNEAKARALLKVLGRAPLASPSPAKA